MAGIGSSQALKLENKIGNIKENYYRYRHNQSKSTVEIKQRVEQVENIWEEISPTRIMVMIERLQLHGPQVMKFIK